MVQKTAEVMTGVTPQWIPPTPVVTKFGTLTGGYAPAIVDTRYSTRAAGQEELQQLMSTVQMDHLRAFTAHGFRKERSDAKLQNRPLLMDFSLIDRHVLGVVHDSVMGPVIRNVSKIIWHPRFRDTVKQAFGSDEKNKLLNHWLRSVATNNKNNGIALTRMEKAIGFMNQGATMMSLGLNIGGAIRQTIGYIPLAGKIGPHRMANAMLQALRNPPGTKKFVMEKSAFMRDQVIGQDRDVRRMAEKLSRNEKRGLDPVRSFMLSQYSFFQNLCNVPGWLESYKIGLKKFKGDDAQAVQYADMVIRTTQGSSSLSDLTTYETSGVLQQLFTKYYSWFRVLHSQTIRTYRRAKYEKGVFHRAGIVMNYYCFMLVLPGVLESIMRGVRPEDDETWPQHLAKEALRSAILGPLEAVPVVRDVLGGMSSLPFRSMMPALSGTMRRSLPQMVTPKRIARESTSTRARTSSLLTTSSIGGILRRWDSSLGCRSDTVEGLESFSGMLCRTRTRSSTALCRR